MKRKRGMDEKAFFNAITVVRLQIVFEMLDFDRKGRILHSDVVQHLRDFCELHLQQAERECLLMIDFHSCQPEYMSFAHFMELVVNIVALTSLKHSQDKTSLFHEIANSMTLSACRQYNIQETNVFGSMKNNAIDEDSNLDSSSAFLSSSSSLHNKPQQGSLPDSIMNKIHRLFSMWDLDHGGSLDVTECALAIYQYQKSSGKDSEATLESVYEWTRNALDIVDENHDLRLDLKEFSILLQTLAKESNVNLRRLIDFLLVRSALQSNHGGDENTSRQYMETIQQLDKQRNEESFHNSFFTSFL